MRISVRIDPETKKGAENVFKKLGLSVTQAITLFYQQVVTQHRLPLLTLTPDISLQKSVKDDEDQSDTKTFDTIEELLENLDSCD